MSTNGQSCHGQFDCLQACSIPVGMGVKDNLRIRLKQKWAHLKWHVGHRGLGGTLKFAISKAVQPGAAAQEQHQILGRKKKLAPEEEVLNLKAGELVEVKSEGEIMATLDRNRRQKGLLWMAGMRKFCGKKRRVLKRCETILLESNGEVRKMKNTVLLEGAMCDGVEFYGCDRSCFHYWREAWLRRVKEN